MGEEVRGKREWQERLDEKLWLVCKIIFYIIKKQNKSKNQKNGYFSEDG